MGFGCLDGASSTALIPEWLEAQVRDMNPKNVGPTAARRGTVDTAAAAGFDYTAPVVGGIRFFSFLSYMCLEYYFSLWTNDVFVSYCRVINFHKFTGLKQYPVITPQFRRSEGQARHGWVLCSGSQQLKSRRRLWLPFHLGP